MPREHRDMRDLAAQPSNPKHQSRHRQHRNSNSNGNQLPQQTSLRQQQRRLALGQEVSGPERWTMILWRWPFERRRVGTRAQSSRGKGHPLDGRRSRARGKSSRGCGGVMGALFVYRSNGTVKKYVTRIKLDALGYRSTRLPLRIDGFLKTDPLLWNAQLDEGIYGQFLRSHCHRRRCHADHRQR